MVASMQQRLSETFIYLAKTRSLYDAKSLDIIDLMRIMKVLSWVEMGFTQV